MKFLLFLLFSVNCLCASAQELFVDWGVPYRRKSTIIKLLPDKGLNFFAYKLSSRNILQTPRIARYELGQPVNIRRIDQKIETNMVVLEELVTFGGSVTGFFRDRRDGINSLYMIRYDQEGEPFGDALLISSFGISKKDGKGSFNVITSADRAFLCVEYIIPAKRDAYDRYGYKVMDSALRIVSEGEYEIPYRQNDVRVDQRYLSNRGDYLLGLSIYNNNVSATNDYSAIEKTVVVQVHNDTISEYEMLIEDKRIFDLGMNAQNGLLTVTGTYGKAFATGAEGAIVQLVDLDGRKARGNFITPFPRDFMTRNMTANQLNKLERNEAMGGNGPQLLNYEIREVHNDTSGSVIVVAEQFFVFQQSSSDLRGISQAVYQYYYNDLLVYKIDTSGAFLWVTDIPKEQVSVNDNGYYSSEISFLSGGRLHILFNDNRRNYDEYGNYVDFLRTATFPSRQGAYALAHSVVDLQTGAVTRSVLNDHNQTNGQVVMKLSDINYLRREILLFSSGKKESFGLLRF